MVAFCDWNLKQLWLVLLLILSNKQWLVRVKSKRCTENFARLSVSKTKFSRIELTLLWLQFLTHRQTFNTTFNFVSLGENLFLRLFIKLLGDFQLHRVLYCPKGGCKVFGCGYRRSAWVRRKRISKATSTPELLTKLPLKLYKRKGFLRRG